MTDIEVFQPPAHVPAHIGGISVIDKYMELTRSIAATPFVPEALRNKPAEILACFMKGYELGMGPMQSLDSIDVIKGKPTLKPEAMRALVNQQGHTIRIAENTNDRCTIRVRRKEWADDEWESFTWTMQDARTASLTSNPTWTKYPRAMLLARVTSEACRAHFSDVIKGLSYTPEEAESFQTSTPPAALAGGGDGASPVETTAQAAIGNGSTKAAAGATEPAPATPTVRPPPGQKAAVVDTTATVQPAERSGESAPATPPAGAPSITAGKLKVLHAVLKGAGYDTDDEQRDFAAKVLGHPVARLDTLSVTEGERVVAEIKNMAAKA